MQRLRLSFAIGCGLVALAGSFATAAQTFPTKPIRIIAPLAAGGTTDILSRAIAPRLAEALGQQVIVENRPGAAGVIGAEVVAKSAPDGHTLGMIKSTHAVTPFVMKSLPYDAVNDLAAVTLVALVLGPLTSTMSVPATTVKEVSQEVGKIIRTPELTERMLSLGAEPSPNSPEEFTAFVKAEMEKWGTLAKKIGLKAE